MSTGRIQVTSADLDNLSRRIQQGASSITTELSGLEQGVQGLITDQWTGAASSAFHDMYTEWQNSARNLNQALEGISTLLTNAATAYDSTEQSITGTMQFS